MDTHSETRTGLRTRPEGPKGLGAFSDEQVFRVLKRSGLVAQNTVGKCN